MMIEQKCVDCIANTNKQVAELKKRIELLNSANYNISPKEFIKMIDEVFKCE